LICIFDSILKRHISEFYGAKTAELLKGIDKDCAEVLKSSFKEFYEVTLEYIDKWYRPEKHPADVAWILLRNRKVKYEGVKKMAKQIDPRVEMADELFDEVSGLSGILQNIPDETFNDGPETKWMTLLSENDSLPLIYKLVSIVFSIPVSNAFVERVFSLVRRKGIFSDLLTFHLCVVSKTLSFCLQITCIQVC